MVCAWMWMWMCGSSGALHLDYYRYSDNTYHPYMYIFAYVCVFVCIFLNVEAINLAHTHARLKCALTLDNKEQNRDCFHHKKFSWQSI